MNLSVKLKHTQLASLVYLLENSIDPSLPKNRYGAIIEVLMVKLYKKLKEKTVLMEPRNYTFSIGPETAMAFIEFFQNKPFQMDSYEGNIVLKLINQFDKQTANSY